MSYLKIRSYLALGPVNLFQVLIYRLKVKLGFFRFKDKTYEEIKNDFYILPSNYQSLNISTLNWQWKGFGHISQSFDRIPNWHSSLLNGAVHPSASTHWSQIKDFSESVGDIKGIWENSRWDWLWILAQYSAVEGKIESKVVANHWLKDWNTHNPTNIGPNWMCAQEASIRVFHLAAASILFKELKSPSLAVQCLLEQHLQRISSSLAYGKAQNNNHGTSEAAALWVGASWLLETTSDENQLSKRKYLIWIKKARALLEDRVAKLIADDGSFSQYSVNYHRLMLDTLSFVECWRVLLALNSFSEKFYNKASLATHWQIAMTQTENGFTPNLGANDGANLFPLLSVDFLDYRPSCNFASVLFLNKIIYTNDTAQGLLNLFDLKPKESLPVSQEIIVEHEKKSVVFPIGGYVLFANKKLTAYFRFPNFKFRPSHCDALNLDVFYKGDYLLRDGGSFSYNPEIATDYEYFSGAESHNTIQFDNRNQMPRISRFLWGNWLSSKFSSRIEFDTLGFEVFTASYCDSWGACHQRTVRISEHIVVVEDVISGNFLQATLRWRLQSGDWKVKGSVCVSNHYKIEITCNEPLQSLGITEGFESLYYGRKTTLSVLEARLLKTAELDKITITTKIEVLS